MMKRTTTGHSAVRPSTAWLVRCISILTDNTGAPLRDGCERRIRGGEFSERSQEVWAASRHKPLIVKNIVSTIFFTILVCVLLSGCGIPGGSKSSEEIMEEAGTAQSEEMEKVTEKAEKTEITEPAETAEKTGTAEKAETAETVKGAEPAETVEKADTSEKAEKAEAEAAEQAGASAEMAGAAQTSESAEPQPESLTEGESAEPQPEPLTGEESAEPQPKPLTGEQKTEKMIRDYLETLSLEDKVSGLFIITPEQLTGYDVVTEADDLVQESLEKYPVAGLIFFGQNIVDRDQVQNMLASTKEWGSAFPEKESTAVMVAEGSEEADISSTIAKKAVSEEERSASEAAESAASEEEPESESVFPPFLAIDEEGGNVMRIGSSAIEVPYVGSMGSVGAAGDPEAAYQAGSTIGAYLHELGFNLDLAPDADVLVDPGNVTIGDRSFGSDPELCGQMVHRYVDGLHENGIASCLKHFPGLGDTESDTHTGAAWSSRTIEDYRSTEFLSFGGGIDAGTEMVMISHLSNSELSGSDLPASLNKTIIADLLRTELEFKGIVITDSLRMGAVTEQFGSAEAAVAALEAGVDILLMPADFHAARQGILDAVHDGQISEERIDESLFRILRARAALAES